MSVIDRFLGSPRLREAFYRGSSVPVYGVVQRIVARRFVPLGSKRHVIVPKGRNAGLSMLIDPRSEGGYLRGDHEPWLQDLLAEWLHDGGSFLDVGSHCGFFTMVASRVVGPAGAVWAMEPDPVTFERLNGHVAANGLTNVSTVNAAAWSHSGKVPFASSVATDAGVQGSVVPAHTSASATVQARTIDEIVREASVDVVKIDVEGAEMSALVGAGRLLARRGSRWVVEVHSEELRASVSERFVESGYVIRTTSPRYGDYGQDYVIAEPAAAL